MAATDPPTPGELPLKFGAADKRDDSSGRPRDGDLVDGVARRLPARGGSAVAHMVPDAEPDRSRWAAPLPAC